MLAPFRALATLMAVALLTGCASVGAPPEEGITVTGTGRVIAPPDTALVSLGAEARAPSLADATAEVDRTMRAVLARVKGAGVRDGDVRTVHYAIDPIAEPRQAGDRGARIVGYRVTNVVQVRTPDVNGLGRIVDAAVAAGANVVRDVQFALDDPARVEARARTLAMQDAAARAREIAEAAGVRPGRLLSVTAASPIRPVARMSLATGPGPVEPGQLDVTVNLEVRYAIER